MPHLYPIRMRLEPETIDDLQHTKAAVERLSKNILFKKTKEVFGSFAK